MSVIDLPLHSFSKEGRGNHSFQLLVNMSVTHNSTTLLPWPRTKSRPHQIFSIRHPSGSFRKLLGCDSLRYLYMHSFFLSQATLKLTNRKREQWLHNGENETETGFYLRQKVFCIVIWLGQIRENHRQQERQIKNFKELMMRTSKHSELKAARERQTLSIDASRIQNNRKSS